MKLQHCLLVLWAKGWISYNHIKKYQMSGLPLIEELPIIIEKCGYIPNRDITLQLLLLFEHITQQLLEYNRTSENKINIPYGMTSIFGFESDVDYNMRVYNCSREESVILTVRSYLFNLDIPNDIELEHIDYNKKNGFVISLYKPGMTYKEMQMKFDTMFKDHI